MTVTRPPLRIGIAGLGRLGWQHAENLAFRIRDARLTWACSPVRAELDAATTRLGVERTTTDLADMITAPDLDAIVLVTPTALHADQTIAVLNAGKHVFVEKPLALDLADCQRVEAVAARHPELVAMVGFVRRYDPSYRQAHDDLARGDIGNPFLVRSQTCDRNDPSGFFVQYAPLSGGLFMDCSVHDIDLARWMLGGPRAERVYASGTIALHGGLAAHGDVDNGLALVDFEGGGRAVFYASRTFAHGHETQTEVIGTTGKLLIGHGAARDRVVLSDGRGTHQTSVGDFFERFHDAFLLEMSAFVASCRGDAVPASTLVDAAEATRIGQAITRSLRSGQAERVRYGD